MISKHIDIKKRLLGWFKEESFKRLIRNSSTLLVGETGASLINMVTLIILIKAIGAANYGVIVLIQAYTTTIDQLINFQSWQAFIKYGAEDLAENNNDKLKQLIKQGTIIDFGTAVLGMIVGILIADYVGRFFNWDDNVIQFSKLYSISILFHFSGVPIGILRLFNKFKIFSIQKIIVAMIKLLGVIVAYAFELELAAVIGIYLLSDIFGHVILITISYSVIKQENLTKWWKDKLAIRRDFLSYTIWTNLSTSITLPSKQLDVFIVSTALSVEMVGVYKAFKQITSLLGRLVSPIYQSIYPEFAIILANRNTKKAISTYLKVSSILSIVLIPIIIILSLTSPVWLRVFFGEIFANYWGLFSLLLVYVGLDTITSPSHPLFNAFGYAKQKFVIMGIGNILYLIIAWFLGSLYGLSGIINAYGAQFIFITASKILYIKIKNKNEIEGGILNGKIL